MADDLLMIRRRKKDEWRKREEERRRKRLELDASGEKKKAKLEESQESTISIQTSSKPPALSNNNDNKSATIPSKIAKVKESQRLKKYTGCKRINYDTTDSDEEDDDKNSHHNLFFPHKNDPKRVPKNVGLPHMKASPASSVSLSQSPGLRLRSISKSRTAGSDLFPQHDSLPPKTNISHSRQQQGISLLGRKKRPNMASDNDSSSSEEIDLLALAKEKALRQKEREQAASQQLSIQQASSQQSKRSSKIPAKSEHVEVSSTKFDNAKSTEAVNTTKNPPRKPLHFRNTFMDDSSESTCSDEDLLSCFKRTANKQQNTLQQPNEEEKIYKNETPSDTPPPKQQLAHPQNFFEEQPSTRTTPRNPLALMKEDSVNSFSNKQRVSTFQANDAATKLWSDSEEESTSVAAASQTKRKTKKKADNDDESKSVPLQKKKKRTTRSATIDTEINVGNIVVPGLSTEDFRELEEDMIPYFADAKFGPYKFEPLQLGKHDDSNYQVPPSINQYLATYQQEGIRFLFNKAILSGRGAILGDDMGLGKTIQIVSLLAALLQKMGNGLDAFELNRRKRLVEAEMSRINDEKERALLQGRLPIPDTAKTMDIKGELNLPKWVPILIIAPNSIVRNWVETFSTWGHFGVAVYQGSSRAQTLELLEQGIAEVLVCTKSMFERKEDFDHLMRVEWKFIVVDEFHHFKNEKGHLAKNLRCMRDSFQSVVVGLTGTVMSNDHKEVWSLSDLVYKDYFGPWSVFESEFARPIKLSLSRTDEASEHIVELGRTKAREFSSRFFEIYIRRTKDDVLANELPDKDEHVVFCEPTELQKTIYRYILKQPDFKLLSQSNGPCDCGVNQKFFQEYQHLPTKELRIEYQRKHRKKIVRRCDCCYQTPLNEDGNCGINPRAILWLQHHENGDACGKCPFCIFFTAVNILYKLSSHASLLQLKVPPEHHASDSKARKDAINDLRRAKHFIPEECLLDLPGQSYVRRNGIMDDHLKLSGKMVVLDKLLRIIKSKQGRVLLFSYSTQTLDLIENYLIAVGYSYLRMDGSTTSKRRTELANEFKKNDDIFLFLLSTKAMGHGLNLTEANFVIIFDVDWNPSNDAQAQDRAYRIGQEKNVSVFRLVSQGTIEEMKWLRQVYKTHLTSETIVEDEGIEHAPRMFRGVAGDQDRRGELFGLANLMKFKDGTYMNYSSKESSFRQYGVGVHNTKNLLEQVQKLTEADLDEIGGDVDLLDGVNVQIKKKDDTKSHEKEELELGGETQIMMEICDRKDSAFSSSPETTKSSSSDSSARDLATENKRAGKFQGASESFLDRKEMKKAGSTRKSNNFEAAPLKGLNHGVKPTNRNCTFITPMEDALSMKAEQKLKRTVKTSIDLHHAETQRRRTTPTRNSLLVGKTTDKIRSGAVGKTTFRAKDLYLPGGFQSKKRSSKR